MSDPFVRRLGGGVTLGIREQAALAHLVRDARTVPARRRLLLGDETAPDRLVLLSGWACRWRILGNGAKQITDLILPGDVCALPEAHAAYGDDSLEALSPCTVAVLDPAEVEAAVARWPNLRRALRWSERQSVAILREALVSNGRRPGAVRLAHLVCEVAARLRAAGALDEAADGSFGWPLTQEDMADVTSLTSVHVNRMLRALREAGLATLVRRRMTVPDLARLEAFCGFSSGYLMLAPVEPPADPS